MAPFWTSVFQVCTYATQLVGCASKERNHARHDERVLSKPARDNRRIDVHLLPPFPAASAQGQPDNENSRNSNVRNTAKNCMLGSPDRVMPKQFADAPGVS